MAETSRSRTAIVADGEPIFLIETVGLLEDVGFTVREARDRAGLLAALASPDPIELVVVGSFGSNASAGGALAREAKGLRPDIAVLATPLGSDGLAVDGEGGIALLPRPYSPAAFRAAVARVLA